MPHPAADRRRRAGCCLTAAAVATLAFAGAAEATVTESRVTTPSGLTNTFVDVDAPVAPTIAIAGTSDGTSGDQVDLRCTRDGNSGTTVVAGVNVDANGTFSTTANIADLGEHACRLRAVPSSYTGRITPFQGPVVSPSRLNVTPTATGGPNDGEVLAFDADIGDRLGLVRLGPLDEGIDESRPISPPSFDDEGDGWNDGAAFPGAADSGGPRASIRVDGVNALAPSALLNFFPGAADTPGLPGITVLASRNGETGDFTVTTTDPIVRCPDASIPPDAVKCPSVTSAGIAIDRVATVTADGAQTTVADTVRSTDGAAHTVTLSYWNDFNDSETGWKLAPSLQFERYDEGDLVSGDERPAAPFSLTAKEADDEPDNSLESGFAAVTFLQQPLELRWSEEDRMEAVYVVSVPADGSARIVHVYSGAHREDDIDRLTRGIEDPLAGPAVAFTAPNEGANVFGNAVTVTGTATDNVGVTSLSVNGVPAVVGPGGTWIATVPLALGANTVTAVARDAAGNQAQASRTIISSSVQTPPERVAPQSITARLSPTRDRKAPFATTVSGRITPPAGVNAAEACTTGVVAVRVLAGTRVIDDRIADVRTDCRFRTSISLRTRKTVGNRSSVRVRYQFVGTRLLLPTTARNLTFRVK